MSKIKLEMSMIEVVAALTDGNAGAVTACTLLMRANEKVDPQSLAGPLSSLMALDIYEIYADRIWIMFNDVCKRDVRDMLVLLRAVQLGFLSKEKLNYAIDNRGAGVDIYEMDALVCEKLDRFMRRPETEPAPTHRHAAVPQTSERIKRAISRSPIARKYLKKHEQAYSNLARAEHRKNARRANHWCKRSLTWIRKHNKQVRKIITQEAA